jgi:hypothetical protein
VQENCLAHHCSFKKEKYWLPPVEVAPSARGLLTLRAMPRLLSDAFFILVLYEQLFDPLCLRLLFL